VAWKMGRYEDTRKAESGKREMESGKSMEGE
jgi:hypothetical protein